MASKPVASSSCPDLPKSILWFVVLVLNLFGKVPAQTTINPPTVEQLDSAVQSQWERVDALVANGQGDEALETLRRIADEHGDKLAPLPTSATRPLREFQRYATVRERCFARMAKLKDEVPETLAAYRRQLDPQAKRWLDQAISGNDESLLRRIVHEAFFSSFGDDALQRLGELALERGQFNLARYWFEKIDSSLRFPENNHEDLKAAARQSRWLPFRDTDLTAAGPKYSAMLESAPRPIDLVYPDTDIPLPEILARLVIVSIMEGNAARAKIEIDLLRLSAPEAAGTIGGRQGKLVKLLDELLAESREWPARTEDAGWPTFAGDSARTRIASAEVEQIGVPLWSVPLPRLATPHELLSTNRLRVGEYAEGILAYHPIVAKGKAIVQVGPRRDQVLAFDVATGERIFPSLILPANDDVPLLNRSVLGVPRYTGTSLGDLAYFRVGVPVSLSPGSELRLTMPAKLAALDLSSEGKLVWEFSPTGPPWNDEWTLGGPPATDGSHLYLTMLRRGPLRIETHIVALDSLDGHIRWKKMVSAGEPPFEDNTSFVSQHLLSVGQGIVYCNTNNGAVAALDARHGDILWLTTYPRNALGGTDPDRNDLHFYRDLNPCVVYQDLVLVAPTDCDRLFALDATTGIPVWVTRANVAVDAVHILGVGGDNLIASGECLYWIDVYTGEMVGRYPESFRAAPGFARPSPRGYGRGTLAGEHVYWPTRDSILVFDQRIRRAEPTSRPAPLREISLASHGAAGGHLVMADDVLLVAGVDRLLAFRGFAQKR